jgi:hypothetical protein
MSRVHGGYTGRLSGAFGCEYATESATVPPAHLNLLRRVHPVDLAMHALIRCSWSPAARRVHAPLWLPRCFLGLPMSIFRPLHGSTRMFQGLFGMLVSGLMIFFPVVRRGSSVCVCGEFVELGSSLVRLIWHSVSHPGARSSLQKFPARFSVGSNPTPARRAHKAPRAGPRSENDSLSRAGAATFGSPHSPRNQSAGAGAETGILERVSTLGILESS